MAFRAVPNGNFGPVSPRVVAAAAPTAKPWTATGTSSPSITALTVAILVRKLSPGVVSMVLAPKTNATRTFAGSPSVTAWTTSGIRGRSSTGRMMLTTKASSARDSMRRRDTC
nr:hypothetical protein Ade03nite_66540 [Actinoplanes derwentensis]